MFSQKDSVVNFITADHYERMKILSELDQRIKKQKAIYLGLSGCISNYEINNDSLRTFCSLPGVYFQFNNLEIYTKFSIWTSNTFKSIHAIDNEAYENINVNSLKFIVGCKYMRKIQNKQIYLTFGGGIKIVDGLIAIFSQNLKPTVKNNLNNNAFVSAGIKGEFKDLEFEVDVSLTPKYVTNRNTSNVSFGIFNVFFIIKSKIYNA